MKATRLCRVAHRISDISVCRSAKYSLPSKYENENYIISYY